KKPIIYAFIDSQNLNLGTSKNIDKVNKRIYTGWRLDFKKFRRYLSSKFHVAKAFLFIGYIKQNEKLYKMLRLCGYELIFKPTVKDDQGKAKGNAVEYPKYDKAVMVSGDGDFHCLVEYLVSQNKLFRILAPNKHYSRLLHKYNRYVVRVDLLQNSLRLEKPIKKTEISGRSKP
ncbi:MAG: hypothetical protein A2782_02160, partial [Candidatus Blackburnbacteria bacterium RIFCSPHIGHO2_01_FULL_43_15b]